MTEDEARKKWCPMQRHPTWIGGEPSGGNQKQNDYGDTTCKASDCMLWKEETSRFKEGETSASLQELNRRELAGEYMVIGGHCGVVK